MGCAYQVLLAMFVIWLSTVLNLFKMSLQSHQSKKLTESSSRSYQYQWQYLYQIVKHLDPSYCEQFISSFITVDRNFSFFNWIRPENRLSLHNKKNGFCYDSAQGMFETKIMNIIFVVWYNVFRIFFENILVSFY